MKRNNIWHLQKIIPDMRAKLQEIWNELIPSFIVSSEELIDMGLETSRNLNLECGNQPQELSDHFLVSISN